ncbi:MAG: hypothetical protein ACOC1F_00380 [Myxococcota bacterium]
MIRKTVVTLLEVFVLLLAAYAFFFLPVGRRTAFGHMSAILSSEPAQQAAEDIGAAGRDIKEKVVEQVK